MKKTDHFTVKSIQNYHEYSWKNRHFTFKPRLYKIFEKTITRVDELRSKKFVGGRGKVRNIMWVGNSNVRKIFEKILHFQFLRSDKLIFTNELFSKIFLKCIQKDKIKLRTKIFISTKLAFLDSICSKNHLSTKNSLWVSQCYRFHFPVVMMQADMSPPDCKPVFPGIDFLLFLEIHMVANDIMAFVISNVFANWPNVKFLGYW